MKKFLTLSLLLASSVLFVPSAEAKSLADNHASALELNAASAPQWQRNRRVRIVTRTRIVRRGFRTYRETWEYRYFGNGRVTSRLISRIRVR